MSTVAKRPRTWADLREAPAYSLAEASGYLNLPKSTLRNWVCGHRYSVSSGKKSVAPLIALPTPGRPVLSFINIVEAHVLAAIRRVHAVPLRHVRSALNYVRTELKRPRPLIDQAFETNGIHLFVEHLGHLIDASQAGQIAMSGDLRKHLKRITRDSSGVPVKLYPFTPGTSEPLVVIDPTVSFGRPVIARRGVPIAALAERFRAGEGIQSIAEDYSLTPAEVEEAVRCETPRIAA